MCFPLKVFISIKRLFFCLVITVVLWGFFPAGQYYSALRGLMLLDKTQIIEPPRI